MSIPGREHSKFILINITATTKWHTSNYILSPQNEEIKYNTMIFAEMRRKWHGMTSWRPQEFDKEQ